ncbi:zinc finger HIT domain-containing protein 3-like isoform X2 [Clavelina lepadiformis]
MIPDITCEVCKEAQHKYKCPTCRTLYCSVNCYKQHKSNQCQPKQVLPKTSPPISPEKLEGIDDYERLDGATLQLLSESDNLQELLRNPHLKQLLKSVDSSTDKKLMMEKYMQEPIFIEFADTCLGIVRPIAENAS